MKVGILHVTPGVDDELTCPVIYLCVCCDPQL